jgi:hypothetical protein
MDEVAGKSLHFMEEDSSSVTTVSTFVTAISRVLEATLTATELISSRRHTTRFELFMTSARS